jgi:hypothetical protein
MAGAGGGSLVTLKGSYWLMLMVLAHQPQDQPGKFQIFWGYDLDPIKMGAARYSFDLGVQPGALLCRKELCRAAQRGQE